MAQKLKRNINMGFRVNEDEKFFIDKKMEAAGWTNFRSFALHCIIHGAVVHVGMDGVREMNALLRNISGNLNQIAARANATGRVYAADLAEVQARQAAIWDQQNRILKEVTEYGHDVDKTHP